MRVLVDRGNANLNKTDDRYGRTPLAWATHIGHIDVVAILLELNDVDPNIAGACSQAPLSWAFDHGHEEVVTMPIHGATSIPTRQTIRTQRRPPALPRMGMTGSSGYSWNKAPSKSTNVMPQAAEHLSVGLLRRGIVGS